MAIFSMTIKTLSLIFLITVTILLEISEGGDLAKYSTSSNAHVAFVFAGSARSFVLPPVHDSLRYNLVASFCPPGAGWSTQLID
jgi:hypothetical protein